MILIALLMILWGTLVSQFERTYPLPLSNWRVWPLTFTGVLLALFVFMTDALRVAGGGVEVIRNVLPTTFNWPVFMIALALLSTPVIQELWGRAPRDQLDGETIETI